MKFPLMLVTFMGATIFTAPIQADVQGSISSYVWSSQGEFTLDGSHLVVQNQWDINHPVDSLMLSANTYLLELKYNQMLSLDVNFNSGSINDQRRIYTVRDSSGYVTDLNYADVTGRSRLASSGLFYRLMGNDDLAISRLDIGAGYIGYINSVGYNNASIVLDNTNPANNNQTFNERWDEFSECVLFRFRPAHIGFFRIFPPLSKMVFHRGEKLTSTRPHSRIRLMFEY